MHLDEKQELGLHVNSLAATVILSMTNKKMKNSLCSLDSHP